MTSPYFNTFLFVFGDARGCRVDGALQMMSSKISSFVRLRLKDRGGKITEERMFAQAQKGLL